MGGAPSKISHHILPPLSLFDRRAKAKANSKGRHETKARPISDSNSERPSLLKRCSRMEKSGSSSSHACDGTNTSLTDNAADISGGTRRSSRRRTRSIALLQHSEPDAADEDSEHTASRRIRRRIKGKSKQVDEDIIDASNDVTKQTKGKKRQTDDDEEMGEAEQAVLSPEEAIDESSSMEETAKQSVSTQTPPASDGRPVPPVVDPPQIPSSTNAIPRPQQHHSSAPPPLLRSPYMHDVSMADRNRARDQIARALGMGPAGQPPASQSSSTDATQPSMLSALLADILGLRNGQTRLSGSTPGPRPTGTGIGSGDGPRSRTTNGGTSVIVQGALISRTVPSRSSAATATEASIMQRSQSQPADSTTSAARETTPDPSSTPETDTQVATIEEQAAMLIRLLSIATAATAASLVSRTPHQQQRPGQRGSTESFTTTFPSTSSIPSTSRPADTSSQMTEINSAAPSQAATLPASPLSISSSWRQASQTYQLLRERFSGLRSRFRGQHSAAEMEQSQPNNTEGSMQRAALDSQPGSDQGSETQTVESTQQGDHASQAEEEAAGSLRSLSSMLQDAIRDGVSGSERGAAAAHGTGANRVDYSASSTVSNQAQSIHATLDAVRGGTLARGSPSSFDRFLFDLMGDLDAAIRGLPQDNQTVQADHAASDLTMEEQAVRLRRHSDVHDGQLAFYRQFTFQSFSEPRVEDEDRLLPCVVVGVRNLDSSNRSLRIERVNSEAETGVFLSRDEDTVMREGSTTAAAANTTTSPAPHAAEAATSTPAAPLTMPEDRPMSRFLLFVSGGHYPPQHPVFFSSRQEASRDLMILMEFLGAMASMHSKPNTTVTKEQIENSKLRKVTGDHAEIASLVKESKIMENTSERCLICLDDWKDESEHRRLLECGHLFHAPCIDQWLTASNNSCPLCRRQAVATTGPPRSSPPTSLPN